MHHFISCFTVIDLFYLSSIDSHQLLSKTTLVVFLYVMRSRVSPNSLVPSSLGIRSGRT